jgi:predicted DsbA family dithiol-disulfide isomerase
MHEYWFAHPQPITDADVNGVAANVGLDSTKLRACLTRDKYAPAIQASVASAQRMQIYGTPAFLIGVLSPDGSFLRAQRVFVGAQDFEFFQKKIEELLVVNATKPTSPVP